VRVLDRDNEMMVTAVQNKLEGAFKIGIRPQALGSRV